MTPPSRSFVVRFALAASIATASVAPALARDLKINIDPSGSGFTVDGWAMQVSGTGTIFHQCQQDSCGRGSTVSLRKQPPGEFTAATLQQNEQRVAAVLNARLQDKIVRVDVSRARTRNDKIFRMSEISRTVVPRPGVDIGMPQHWKTGFVSTTSSAYTISSSASSRKLAESNYATFQVPLLIIVKMQSQ